MSTMQHGGISPRRLEELPRPVVTFLVSGCKLSLRQAFVGSLRELDKEGLVRFEPDAGGTPVLSFIASEPRSGRSLLPFEEVALERVRTRSGTQGRVPLSAVLSDDGDEFGAWASRQIDEIAQEARRAGLARKRLPRHTWAVILPLIAAAIGAAIVVHGMHPKGSGGVIGGAVVAALVLLFFPIRLYRWRLTPEGTAAVDSWRRDGGGVSGAVLVPGAVGEKTHWGLTTLSGEPLPPGHAWSSLGGQWHTVQLGLELSPAYWSGLQGLGMLLGLTAFASFFSVIIGAAAYSMDPVGKLIAITPAGLGALVIVTCWLPAFTLRMQLPDSVTFVGEVVKKWHQDGGDYSPDHDWVCVDDGSPTTMKFDVGRGTYEALSVGGLVRVTWSPRQRRLLGIEPTQ
jgi:hypothetical protein